MKFLHLGDLHIGKHLYEFNLIDDQKHILEEIVNIAVEKEADGILIAGDIYDKSIPSEEAVKLFDYFICLAEAKNLKLFIISGNHDSDERLNFGSSLFETKGIYISSKFEGKLYKRQFTDQYGPVNIYLLPYVKGSQVRDYYPEAEINSYNDAVKLIIDNTNIDVTERNIIVAHQYVISGNSDPVLGGSESLATKNVGNVEKINSDLFNAFDYVALGHIHSPQHIGRKEVRYAGSPLKYSLAEIDTDKSVPIITFGKKGELELEFEDLKPHTLRDVKHIEGEFNTIIDEFNVEESHNYFYVTLTDANFVEDALGALRKYYPYTINVGRANDENPNTGDGDAIKVAEGKSFKELIVDFYHHVYSSDINDEEMKAVLEAAKEVGIINEAD